MAKSQKYIILIILGCLLFLSGVKVAFGGEVLKYEVLPTISGYYIPDGWKIFSNQNNQYITKITFFGTTFCYGGLRNENVPAYTTIEKYNSNNELITTSSVAIGNINYDSSSCIFSASIYPNLTLNNGEYLKIYINWFYQIIDSLMYNAFLGNSETFNNTYFTAYAYADNFQYAYSYPALRIYTISPDNPQIYQFSPSQGLSFGSNYLKDNFTSSSPFSFYVSNISSNASIFFFVKDDFTFSDKWWASGYRINYDGSESTIKVDIDWQMKKYRINNGNWEDLNYEVFIQSGSSLPSEDLPFYGKVYLKVQVFNWDKNLGGENAVYYNFPVYSGAISEEKLGLFLINADNNQGLNYIACGSPSNSSTPLSIDINHLNIQVFSCGLIQGQSYQLRFYLINTTDNEVLFQDFIRYSDDFNYSQKFVLDNNKLYKVVYSLFKNGNLIYDGEFWFNIGQITSPFLTFSQFYQAKISGFGFPTSTTPTPAFSSFGSFIDKIFNPINLFLLPNKQKIDNLKISIIQNINNLIAYISGFNNQLGYFSLLFYGLIIFIVIEVVIKVYKLISPFK